MSRRFVDFKANLKATAALREMRAQAIPIGGVDLQKERPHVAGGQVFFQIIESPPNAPRNRFPEGSFMFAILEMWPDRPGHAVPLRIGERGYATADEAATAGLPEYTKILAARRV